MRRHALAARGGRLLALLLLITSTACRSAATGGAAPSGPAPAAVAADSASRDPDSIVWVRDAVEYRAAVWQVYRAATARIESEARSRASGSWAVILDADETVISNVTYQVERARLHLPYSADSWRAWVQRRAATPLPGAKAFLARTRELGGRIAIVTNRLAAECADTEAVFHAHDLVYDAMLCRPDGSPSDKNPRFDAVAAGRTPAAATPLTIVAFIGDNILDFPALTQAVKTGGEAALARFGARFFMIPNPMYGSWQ